MSDQSTVKARLLKLLPEVLPSSADKAINGTELLKRLRDKGFEGSTEDSLRAQFSTFAGDPSSPVAKVASGHGYFRRPILNQGAIGDVGSADLEQSIGTRSETSNIRDEQREEKFRSLYRLWAKQDQQHAVSIEHTKAKKQTAGINRWKFPDVVSVNWNVDLIDEQGHFDADMADVMRGLGEQPFTITSTELKVAVTSSSLRSDFFQCVSNSKWAHNAQLAIATEVTDQVLSDELKRLGASYGVTIVSFGLNASALDALPAAGELLEMSDTEVDDRLAKISLKTIASGQAREILDWDHIRDLQRQTDELRDIFAWIARCLSDNQAHGFELWKCNLRSVKK